MFFFKISLCVRSLHHLTFVISLSVAIMMVTFSLKLGVWLVD
jgi:hypothetical protein